MSAATSTPGAGAGAEAGAEAPADLNNPDPQTSLDSTIIIPRSSRAGKAGVYPPAGQIRRPRKKNMTWVADRLSQLEKFFPARADDSDRNPLRRVSPSTPPSTKASSSHLARGSTTSPAEADQVFVDEVLMQRDSQSQYFNEILLSKVIRESSLRLYNRGKGVWSELWRRVWWHFFGRDSRAAEDYGLQKVCNLRSDVDLPLNVDDADLRPDMESLPPARTGVTAMAFPLVTYEIARAVHRLAGILAGATSASPPKESVRKQIIDETRARIEMSLKQCNLVIPRHRLALRMSHLALRKADFVSR
ncbi:hypothetical protein INS49_013366 [Diaporthe citri]|uniref:uncharacterized protein n=1 Tax=Diaporthe citri TaxID=83186 RepID=UPI001C8208D2|nr:uncharacterized protein INS49_013366 [Diaporthe citri]KAG6357489.1 hypothetical protein INS49_013366 [Diaporthe citri]